MLEGHATMRVVIEGDEEELMPGRTNMSCFQPAWRARAYVRIFPTSRILLIELRCASRHLQSQ